MKKKKSREHYGTGSVYFNEAKGFWVGSLVVGRYANGSPKRQWVKSLTERGARLEVDNLRHLRDHHEPRPSIGKRVTVAEHTNAWLDMINQSNRQFGTRKLYEGYVRNHITPTLGTTDVRSLDRAAIDAFMANLSKTGASPSLLLKVFRCLYTALKYAVDLDLIKDNPCQGVESPEPSPRRMVVLTKSQIGACFKAAETDRLQTLYHSSFACGVRIGESFALHKTDLDLIAGTMSIQQTTKEEEVKDAGGRVSLTKRGHARTRITTGEPKTPASKRLIKLPAFVVDSFKKHFKRMAAEGHENAEFVFCNARGEGPIQRPNFVRRSFDKVIRRANQLLPRTEQIPTKQNVPKTKRPAFRPHDMRHTAASIRLAQGDHPKVVQEMLGHKSIAMTLDLYSHLMPSLQGESAQRTDATFQAMQTVEGEDEVRMMQGSSRQTRVNKGVKRPISQLKELRIRDLRNQAKATT